VTFGLTGRIVITVVLLLVLVGIAIGDAFGVPVYLIVLVWALRDVWAPARRPAPAPPRRRAPGRGAPDDRPAARSVYDEIPRTASPAATGYGDGASRARPS
jgi:hypothetical protein